MNASNNVNLKYYLTIKYNANVNFQNIKLNDEMVI